MKKDPPQEVFWLVGVPGLEPGASSLSVRSWATVGARRPGIRVRSRPVRSGGVRWRCCRYCCQTGSPPPLQPRPSSGDHRQRAPSAPTVGGSPPDPKRRGTKVTDRRGFWRERSVPTHCRIAPGSVSALGVHGGGSPLVPPVLNRSDAPSSCRSTDRHERDGAPPKRRGKGTGDPRHTPTPGSRAHARDRAAARSPSGGRHAGSDGAKRRRLDPIQPNSAASRRQGDYGL